MHVFLLQGEESENRTFLFNLSMTIKRSGIFVRDGESFAISKLDANTLNPDQQFILELAYKMMSLVYMNEADPDYYNSEIIKWGEITEEIHPMLDVYDADEVNNWLRANLSVLGNFLKNKK